MLSIYRVSRSQYLEDVKNKKNINRYTISPMPPRELYCPVETFDCYSDDEGNTISSCHCTFDEENYKENISNFCLGLTYIKCPQCSSRTDYAALIDCVELQMLSYFCQNCSCWYQACVKCLKNNDMVINPMKLVVADESEVKVNPDMSRSIEDWSTVKIQKEGETIYVSSELHCWPEKILGLITGPDGGYPSDWYCNTCEKQYHLVDK